MRNQRTRRELVRKNAAPRCACRLLHAPPPTTHAHPYSTPTLTALRTLISTTPAAGGRGENGGEAAAASATDWSAAAPTLPPVDLAAATLLPDASTPVAAAADALQALHAATGLPWWATLPLAAVAVRAALSPLALASARSAAAAGPLLREARRMEGGGGGGGGGGGDASTTPPPPRAVLAAFNRLRAAAAAPHPAWILAAPLAQLPILAAALLGVRAMAGGDWPGLADGGALWFPDLTARAVEVGSAVVVDGGSGSTSGGPGALLNPSSSALVAPCGPAGAALPAAVAGTLLAAAAVGAGRAAAAGSGLARHLRLGVEWCALPAFLAAAALPQGAALYWAASSGAAVAQSLALQSEAGRRLVGRGMGLPASVAAAKLKEEEKEKERERGGGESSASAPPPPPLALDPAAAAAAVAAAGPAGPHLVAAASARAAGDSAAARAAAAAATAAAPGDPRAWFALGQLRAGGRDWGGAGEALGRAVDLLTNDQAAPVPGLASRSPAWAALAARAHLARGVAQAMQGEVGPAAASFAAAVGAARASEGVADDAALVTATAAARAASQPMPPGAALIARAHLARAAALAEDGRLKEALEAAQAGAALEPAAVETHVRALERLVGEAGGKEEAGK